MSNYGTIREYRDDPQFRDYRDEDGGSVAELTEQIRSNIFKINNGANTVERAMKSLGTDRDSDQLRDKIHETSQSTNKVVQSTTRFLRKAAGKPANKQEKIQLDLLKSNFHDACTRFQTLQKKAAAKVKSSVVLGSQSKQPLVSFGVSLTDFDSVLNQTCFMKCTYTHIDAKKKPQQPTDSFSLLSGSSLKSLAGSMTSSADILDVNEIFRELGALVHTQGEVLDTIDSNVEVAYSNVESGNEQLIKAAEYQRKSRKKMCCLVVIFLVIAVVITIIVVVSIKA
ncbi:unnamed protein product [Lymnaea stagnalis]|uniref:t-SNARE coiled-coil homology domain-containing protein n=1 Tax=Lymnaea stagnalis TaxID=6523 RepID=A0AAV2I9D4_LYMST